MSILRNVRTICTTPPGCHNGCGIIAAVDDGRVTEICGDPSNPFNDGSLCPRGAALRETVYHPDRQLHPLIKTSAGWRKASWNEALGMAGDAFLKAREKHGPSSVIFCKGTGRDIGPWLSRLAYSFGSSEYYALGPGSGSACLMPRMSVTNALFGGFMVADCSQYFPKRYNDPRWRLPECILIWGSNPVDSNPDGFLGQWIVQCLKLGSRMIVVDPRETWMARRADLHLQINPGTDAALAMAFLHMLFKENMVKTEFTERWVNGADEVRKQSELFSPEMASAECGIPARDIISAALLYGQSEPAALHWGVSVDMSPSALGTAHALTSLVVLSGNLDVPGGNVIVTDPFGISRRGVDRKLAESLQKTKTGISEYPMIGSGVPYALADTLLDEIENGRSIECAWYQGTGLTANGFAEPKRVGKLLSRTGFSVMVDLFMSPAADELANIFLPVCTCLERSGIRNWWYQLAAFDRVIEPLGESRSDMEVVLSFGRIVAREHFPWSEVTEWFDHILKPSGHTWSELCRKGWLMPGTEYSKHLTNGGFNTPTGKIELQPGLMEKSSLLPAPWYVPPPSSEKRKKYPLKLTTGARSPLYFHGEHRNVQHLRELEPLPVVEVHPDDMPHGIRAGDWILLESPWGSCIRVVNSSLLIKKGVLSASHGWKGPGLNINDLLTSGMQGRGGLGYPFRCLPCRISGPVDAPEEYRNAPAVKSADIEIIEDVQTIWCTGCRACAVACVIHTGIHGIVVRLKDGEWTPGFTSSCLGCSEPPCVAVCHTECLIRTGNV
ncbi:MAG: molybdopterin-dependent oxidoreductase [Candidatus Aegiribacteria sp.]|nr:molybdopterin-dependent oxidoreductase [Candidatus Aegiribacteria sp.]